MRFTGVAGVAVPAAEYVGSAAEGAEPAVASVGRAACGETDSKTQVVR